MIQGFIIVATTPKAFRSKYLGWFWNAYNSAETMLMDDADKPLRRIDRAKGQ